MMRIIPWVFLFLVGCTLGPRYETPVETVPCEWKQNVESSSLPKVDEWWDLFQDPVLSDLEKIAIEKNLDLYIAMERIAEGRATTGIAKSYLYPEINLNPSFNNVQELIELYGVPQAIAPTLKTITRVREQSYSLPVAMSYEVDLWGKYRGTYHAAQIYTEALEEAKLATLLSVTTDVASNYYNIRDLDRQLELLETLISLQKETIDLLSLRYQKGISSLIDYNQSIETLSNYETEYDQLLAERNSFENGLALLLGENASDFTIVRAPIENLPPVVPPGLTSDLLARRPDIAQAERAMAAFHAFIGVAYATYFPSLNLTSNLGYLSPDLSKWLTWASRLWQFGANIGQVLFNAGRNASYVELAKARFEEAKGYYQRTVLTAFSEVETALSQVEDKSNEIKSFKVGFDAAFANQLLFQLRMDKGVSDRLEVISYLKQSIELQRSYCHAIGQSYQANLQLIKAIGGKWTKDCDDSLAKSFAE